jgi:hypothetical protein
MGWRRGSSIGRDTLGFDLFDANWVHERAELMSFLLGWIVSNDHLCDERQGFRKRARMPQGQAATARQTDLSRHHQHRHIISDGVYLIMEGNRIERQGGEG